MTKSEHVEFVMPTVTFVEDYEPTSQLGRKAEDNPFNDVVTALAATYDKELGRSKGAATLVITKGETRIRVAAKVQKAARAQGFTARIDDKATQNGLAVIAVYLVPIITRTRKSKTVTITNVNDTAEESNLEVADDQTVEQEPVKVA